MKPTDQSQPGSGDRPGCADARAGMRAFVVGSEPASPPPAWREHMIGCMKCTMEYHELVQGVARLARGATQTTARTTDMFESGRDERVRRSLLASDARKGMRLPRLFLPLAVVGLLAFALSRAGAPRPVLRALAGVVTRATAVVDPSQPVAVVRGDAIATGPRSRARLDMGPSSIRFEPESSFLVDRTDQLAVRFFAGTALVEGDALLILPTCAIEVREGAAQLDLSAHQLTIRCDRGVVRRSDAHGHFLILPGETSSVLFRASDTAAAADVDER